MKTSRRSDAKHTAPEHATKARKGATPGKKPIRVSQRTAEELELAAHLLEKIKDVPDVREELCERIRQQISDGAYETAERLDAAAERLVEELLAEAGLETPAPRQQGTTD